MPSVCRATLAVPPTPIVTVTLALLAALVAVILICAVNVPQAAAAPQSARAAAVSAEIGDLDARLDAAVARYGVTSQRLSELRTSMRANRIELRRTEYSLLLAKAELRRRVIAMYKERPVDLLDVVMGSADFDELLGKLAIVRRLGAADAELVSTTEQLERELLSVRHRLAETATRVQTGLADIARERDSLETMLVQRRALVAELRRAAAARPKVVARPKPAPSPGPTGTVSGQGPWWSAIQAAAAANGIAARGLYRLMLVESGGCATARNGPYYGLFQYSSSTWRGSWNPWRGTSIFDGAAQIKASARAIKLGYGPVFWPNTYGYAFSD
jgi:peptidoglycan hydrolase CwlO-like protein